MAGPDFLLSELMCMCFRLSQSQHEVMSLKQQVESLRSASLNATPAESHEHLSTVINSLRSDSDRVQQLLHFFPSSSFRLILYFRCCFCTMCVDEGVLFWLQCVFVCVVEGGGAGRLADLNSSEMPTSTESLVTTEKSVVDTLKLCL